MTKLLYTGLLRRLPMAISVFMMSSAASVCAQTEPTDSAESAVRLDEIVVNARSVIKSGNKMIFYPPKQLRDAMGSCVQMLAGMQIPRLIVNPASGSVSLSGNNRLSVRVNGREVTESYLASISSKDISKIEIISDPGLRYGGVDAVLDITVKPRRAGYGLMLNLLQSPNRGWGNYSGAVRHNIGKSEWQLDYVSNPMWQMDCFRDNTERITIADGSVIDRFESGIKAPNRMVTHHAGLQYTYAVDNRLLLTIQGRMMRRNDKYVSEGYITTSSFGQISAGFERDISLIKSWQADLDIYMHYKINDRNKLFFNIVPSVTDGSDSRAYESPDLAIASDLTSRGHHLSAEGIWEGRVSGGIISGGIRHFSNKTEADYTSAGTSVKERTYDNSAFAEWKQTFDKIQYSAGLVATLYTLHRPVRYTAAYVNPRFNFRYSPTADIDVALSLNTETVAPSINQLNPVLQRVDMYQWAEGNMTLKPYQKYEPKLEVSYHLKDISASLSVCDTYSHSPVMSAVRYVGGNIVRSYFNCGCNNDFELRAVIRMPLFVNGLSLSLDGGWHTTLSKDPDYRHTYSQPFVNAQLMYLHGPWWIMARYNNSYNVLWGETITSVNHNLLNFGIGYTYRKATFMAGIVNPFGNVSIRSKDLSRLVSYDRTYHASGSNQLVWLGVTINLYHGHKQAKQQKRINNKTIYESINNQTK